MTADTPVAAGNYYAEGLYCETDVARGVTRSRSGTRLCCLTTDFLLGFRRAVIDECGPAADLVFKSCGRKWGGFAARRFDDEMTGFHGRPLREFTMAQFRAAVADLFSHHGWGMVDLDLSRHDQGLVVVTVSDPLFASITKGSGEPEQPVESLTAGVLAGFFAALFEQDLDCVQTSCVALGDSESRFVIGLSARLAGVPNLLTGGKKHDQILKELANIRL